METVRTGCDIEQDLTGTEARIAEAALETLKARRFAGASAPEIARTGGFNQALPLYHFGSVHNALLSALELVSNHRVRAHEPGSRETSTPKNLETGYIRCSARWSPVARRRRPRHEPSGR
jgi:hypothetical protein